MMEYLAAGVVNRDQRDEEEARGRKTCRSGTKKGVGKQAARRPAEENEARLSIDFVANLI